MLGNGCRRHGMAVFGQRCGQCGQYRLHGRFGVRALTTDLNFVVLADGQTHQPDQAVAGRRFTAEMQSGFTLEALRRLPDQRRRPGVQSAAMGDADVAMDFFSLHVHFSLRTHWVAANDVQQRFTHLDRLQGDRSHLEVLAVGQDHQADQAFALLRDLVQVVAQQRLAVGDSRTFLDQHGEALALQLDRVQAQVKQ
ncbi:hypothetical protein D3C87_1583760 [compost metagenome]